VPLIHSAAEPQPMTSTKDPVAIKSVLRCGTDFIAVTTRGSIVSVATSLGWTDGLMII
jgi:hypothetical protein